jgi:hypothetical protein
MRMWTVVLGGALALAGTAFAQDAPKGDERLPDKKAPAPDEKKPDEAPDATKPDAKAPKKGQKAPEVGKAAVVGEQLPAGTVSRKGLYPLDEGRRWTYELKVWLESIREDTPRDESLLAEGPRLQRLEVKVGEPQKIDAKDARVLDSFLDGELIQRQFFIDTENEVECVRRVQGIGDHAKDNALSPGQKILSGELKVGQKWEWKGKVGAVESSTSYEVLREEKITVKAGSYNCLVIKADVTADDESRGVRVQWLAPGVGLVREETEVKTPTEVWRTQGELVKNEGPKKK